MQPTNRRKPTKFTARLVALDDEGNIVGAFDTFYFHPPTAAAREAAAAHFKRAALSLLATTANAIYADVLYPTRRR